MQSTGINRNIPVCLSILLDVHLIKDECYILLTLLVLTDVGRLQEVTHPKSRRVSRADCWSPLKHLANECVNTDNGQETLNDSLSSAIETVVMTVSGIDTTSFVVLFSLHFRCTVGIFSPFSLLIRIKIQNKQVV